MCRGLDKMCLLEHVSCTRPGIHPGPVWCGTLGFLFEQGYDSGKSNGCTSPQPSNSCNRCWPRGTARKKRSRSPGGGGSQRVVGSLCVRPLEVLVGTGWRWHKRSRQDAKTAKSLKQGLMGHGFPRTNTEKKKCLSPSEYAFVRVQLQLWFGPILTLPRAKGTHREGDWPGRLGT